MQRSMLRILTALVLSMLSGAGLAAPGGAEQARPPAETELPSRAATVRWIPRSSAAGELALTARIEFARPLPGGDLSLTVPSGLRLIDHGEGRTGAAPRVAGQRTDSEGRRLRTSGSNPAVRL